MGRTLFALGIVVTTLMLAPAPAAAHHSSAMFDSSQEVTLKGTVVEWKWINPHATLRLDVKGRDVLLVDDILRTGRKLSELKALVEAKGGEVVGLAVVIYQPYPEAKTFDPLPFYYLAKLDANYYPNSAACELCKKGEPAVTVNV